MIWVNLGLTIIGFAISIIAALIASKKRCDKRLKSQKERIIKEIEEGNGK